MGLRDNRVWLVFQSHAGSIEAGEEVANAFVDLGFNPTLVRLRLLPVRRLVVIDPSFNPTLVRLRGWKEGGDDAAN